MDGWSLLHHALMLLQHRGSHGDDDEFRGSVTELVEQCCKVMPQPLLSASTQKGYPLGWTPLHICVNGNDHDQRTLSLRALISHRADVNEEVRMENCSCIRLQAWGTNS